MRREFALCLRRHGFDPSADLAYRLADRFLKDGWSHPNDVDAYIVLHYADPTGETAVHNVMRGRRTR